MRRAIYRDAPAELVAKFTLSGDRERFLWYMYIVFSLMWNRHQITLGYICTASLRFSMLKQWMMNQSVADIDVEEKWISWVAELRTDRYVTVP